MSDLPTTEVVVVGAGVAGLLLADKLASSGVAVTVLEAGPRIDRFDALDRFFASPVKVPESPYPDTPAFPHPRTDKLDAWYVQAGPETFKATYLKAAGGTTWHWLGTCLRLLPGDFELGSCYGIALDWPFGYQALEPWYQAAEEALGIAGDPADDLGSPRNAPYPLPPIPLSYCDRAFVKALEGTRYRVSPTPQARLSVDRDDRPACCGSASCIPICPVQAKYDATIHLARAEAAGARIETETTAVALEVGDGGRVSAIRFKRPDGSEGRIVGKVVVVAAHAIETPRLLLNSRSEAVPKGVANASDQIGRNLMDHPMQLTWALATEPVFPYRGPLSTAGIDTTRRSAARGEAPAFRIELYNGGWSWPKGAPATTAGALAESGLRGKALAEAMARRSAREVLLSALIEQLPDPENRVTLDPELRDYYGVPRPRIAYSVSDYERRGMAHAAELQAEILQRVGVSELHQGQDWESALHIMGTARLGEDPKTSVVDPELRSHDHPNLFLLGSAVFPTGAAANPTLTIAALSLRAVEAVQKTLSG